MLVFFRLGVASSEVMAVEFRQNIFNVNISNQKTNNVKTLLSSGEGDACGSGFEGVGNFMKYGVPKFVAEGCSVSSVE